MRSGRSCGLGHGRGLGCRGDRSRGLGHGRSDRNWGSHDDRTFSRWWYCSWRSCHDRRPGDNGAGGRSTGDGRSGRDYVCALARKWDDAARCYGRLSGRLSWWCRRRSHRGSAGGRCNHTRRCHTSAWRRRRDDGSRPRWRRCFCGRLSLLALEDSLQGVARLGDLGEVKLRLRIHRLPARTTTASAVFEVVPNSFGLIGFNRAGVGLSRYANRFERVQNRPALYFQFSCQIVNSNFAHPSLFACPARLAVHSSLIVAGVFIVSAITGFRESATQGMLWCMAQPASHDRFRRRYLHPSFPGSHSPGSLRCRYPIQSVLRGHLLR